MSTRATYEIDGTTFYCHWDGYPAGAAFRFARMVAAWNAPELGSRSSITALEDRRGGATFAFIRGNLDAEPTESHEAHGDTEYRYRVRTTAQGGDRWSIDQARAAELEATIQIAARRPGDPWGAWSQGEPLSEWINRAGMRWEGGEPAAAIVAFRSPQTFWPRTILATIGNARVIARRAHELAAKYDDSNPNRATHLLEAAAWDAAIARVDVAPRIARLEKARAELAEQLEKPGHHLHGYVEAAIAAHDRELEALRGEKVDQAA